MHVDWLGLSEKRLEGSCARLTSCESVLGGFNLIVDRIKRIDSTELEQLVSAVGIELMEDPSAFFEKMKQNATILDHQGLVKFLAGCVATGNSIEVPVGELDVFQWLNNKWDKTGKWSVGGQPAHMALAACSLVPRIVLAGWPTPASFAKLIQNIDNIDLVVYQHDEMQVKPIRDCQDLPGHDYANWAIDFSEGLEVRIGSSKVECPKDGRFIANWYPRMEWMNSGTSDRIQSSGIQPTHAFLSGCQSLCPDMDSDESWKGKVLEFATTIRGLKGGTECRAVHYEMGTMRGALLEKVIEEIFPTVDSVGCNEVELVSILDTVGEKKIASRIRAGMPKRAKMSIVDVYNGAYYILQRCGLRRIHVHTWDFHVSISRAGANTHVVERDALLFGAVMGAAKTYTGLDIQQEHIDDGLKTPFSPDGIGKVEELHEKPEAVGTCVGDGTFKTDDVLVCIVPGRVKEGLDSAVGLGDTLSSMAFLAAAG